MMKNKKLKSKKMGEVVIEVDEFEQETYYSDGGWRTVLVHVEGPQTERQILFGQYWDINTIIDGLYAGANINNFLRTYKNDGEDTVGTLKYMIMNIFYAATYEQWCRIQPFIGVYPRILIKALFVPGDEKKRIERIKILNTLKGFVPDTVFTEQLQYCIEHSYGDEEWIEALLEVGADFKSINLKQINDSVYILFRKMGLIPPEIEEYYAVKAEELKKWRKANFREVTSLPRIILPEIPRRIEYIN